MQVQGQCHCGQIRYEAQVDPATVRVCHCTDCRTLSGGAFRVSVRAPAETLVMQGKPATYTKTAQSGAKRVQGFCSNCGTSLFSAAADNPQAYMLRISALKQCGELKPGIQIWMRSALPWTQTLHDLEVYEEQGGPL